MIDDWLEQALSLGISYKDFWEMTPRIIKIHAKAHQKRIDETNVLMHIQGMYVRDAIACTIGNSFRPKSAKPFEYPKEPYQLHEKELTEQDKQAQIREFFDGLMARKARFDAQKS